LVPGSEFDSELSSKFELLFERLTECVEEGHKALVFSQWTKILDLLEPLCKARGIAIARLDGGTRNRSEVVSQFQSAAGPPVFLISLKAGGVGLTLTEADHVFLLDPWWNPAVEKQAGDRAHRIGQEKPVFIYRLIAENTVEEKILALQRKKAEWAEAFFENEEGPSTAPLSTGINRNDILELLS
jgi:SNF2 family DNA or RNA helicase